MSASTAHTAASTEPETATFLDALVGAVLRSAAYNSQAECPPAAILWTDEARQWEPLLPELRERLPLVALGPYSPEVRTGPAYWLRCVIDGALPLEWSPGVSGSPVVYLPGVSRPQMRAVEDCAKELQPLAELQYRGVFWSHKNGKDWTVAGFLQSADGGLDIEVATDAATRQALARALPRLATEPLSRLRAEAPLRSEFLNGILVSDEARSLLQWLNDPEGYPKARAAEEWASFVDICRRKYSFDPERDGEVTAAGLLGGRGSGWQPVWSRFAEAPQAYPNIPDLLRRAQPADRAFFYHPDSWPQENEDAEARLRERLLQLGNSMQMETRQAIRKLEGEHAPRREWVWARLDGTPLAAALKDLSVLASSTERMLPVGTTTEIAAAYAEWGWKVDAAVIDALAAVEHPSDVAAVKAVVNALYRPWLEGAVSVFQAAAVTGNPAQTYPWEGMPSVQSGTCLLFTDALRYDVGQRLADALKQSGHECETAWRLAALPSVTPTAKPAVSPVASLFTGEGAKEFDPVLRATGTRVTIQVLRKALEDEGFQVLRGAETGDPTGRAWTEAGRIDSYGHEHGWLVARHLGSEIRALAVRVQALLGAGWRQVTVITDHGWLLLPGGLPKADLPLSVTEARKGRCARIKEGAAVQEQMVTWHWDSQVRVALARGIHAYEAGKEYEHGGLSPQECVVPMLTVRAANVPGPAATIESIVWRRLRCRVQASAPLGSSVDIRTRPADPGSSVLKEKEAKALTQDRQVSLAVEDPDLDGSAAVVVVLDDAGRVRAQRPTMIGQDD